jgi:Uma2 family endonuclease
MATATKLVTYGEWLNMPEVSDVIEEVVNGVIVPMPPPKAIHAYVVDSLGDMLKRHVDRAQVRVLLTQFGLVIRKAPLAVRIPDLAMFRKSNVVEEDGYFHSAPELVVEVLSPSNNRSEREAKLRDYESLGVPEVWVLSPEARTIEVLLLEDGKLRTVGTLREGQLGPKHFPEAVVDVASVWPD